MLNYEPFPPWSLFMQFFVPAMLPDGWCLYALDFIKKCIIVLDPRAAGGGFSNKSIKIHEFVSDKILDAVFHCGRHFYSNWPQNREVDARVPRPCWTNLWKVDSSFSLMLYWIQINTIPIHVLMFPNATFFCSHQYGMCITYFAKYFDGIKLVKPLTKVCHSTTFLMITLFSVYRLSSRFPRSSLIQSLLQNRNRWSPIGALKYTTWCVYERTSATCLQMSFKLSSHHSTPSSCVSSFTTSTQTILTSYYLCHSIPFRPSLANRTD